MLREQSAETKFARSRRTELRGLSCETRRSSVARASSLVAPYFNDDSRRDLGQLTSQAFVALDRATSIRRAVRQAGSGLPLVSSPKGKSSKPTMKAKAVRATGVPRV